MQRIIDCLEENTLYKSSKAYKLKKNVSDIVRCRKFIMASRKIELKIWRNKGRIFIKV